jgi:hypothetical protein
MNLKLRYSIIIIDLSLKNPKIQELPGALPPGHPTTFIGICICTFFTSSIGDQIGYIVKAL